jgi:hypothetical protein
VSSSFSACRCRALQGFAQSQRDLAFSGLPVPNYTTLSRRTQKVEVILPAPREVAIRVGVLNRMTTLACPQSVRIT